MLTYTHAHLLSTGIPPSVTEVVRSLRATDHYASDWTYAEDIALISEAYLAGVLTHIGATLKALSPPAYAALTPCVISTCLCTDSEKERKAGMKERLE